MATIDPDEYVFDFGQYHGYSYQEIFKIDPGYIEWCYQSGCIELDTEAIDSLTNRLAG